MIGIDHSYTSPAICVTNQQISTWYYLNGTKKRIIRDEALRVYGTLLPDFVDDIAKFDFISDWVLEIVQQYPDQQINIEGYAMNAMGRTFQIGENTGLLKYKLLRAGRQYNLIAPTVVKKFATRSGNASKSLMEIAFKNYSEIDFRALTNQPDKAENPSSDLIDAYFLSRYNPAGP